MPDSAALLEKTARLSRFAARVLSRDSALLNRYDLGAPIGPDVMRQYLANQDIGDSTKLHRALRRLREVVMLHSMARDLGGLATLEEVTATMTALAEVAITFALPHLERDLAAKFGTPVGGVSGQPQHLMVIAMGKLGGGELNVSSDIDLVFAYPEEGLTNGERAVSCQEYFTRLGRNLIAALNDITENGQVFRVDMRLRPYGDSGPLVVSLDMLEEYLTAQGREWERYAWVKARALTGDRDAELAALVTPFVFRRHLDFSALQSMRDLHAQVRAEVTRRDIADNIKLGPGGIREIEFTTQVFQLIRGGRDPALRVRPTMAALRVIRDHGWIASGACDELAAAYRFLRALEHRLQYLEDQQTHRLPRSDEDRALIAESMNCRDFLELEAQLAEYRGIVTRHFESIFSDSERVRADALAQLHRVAPDDAQARQSLTALGYLEPARVIQRLRALHDSARFKRMSASTQARFDQLIPKALRAAAAFSPIEIAFERALTILESIGRRESYLALLIEYPRALEAMVRLASRSAWATDYLSQHPMLLDELIDVGQLAEPNFAAAETKLKEDLAQAEENTERQMDLLRHFKHAHTFRLLLLDLAERITLERLSDHLSDLASVIVRNVLTLAWRHVRSRHRADPQFAIIAYGKFGGKELGYATDLDIIFLYADDAPDAAENYARLAQRINTWLTSHTATGILYETDLRLRPDGASGLLVSTFEAYCEYQRKNAWVWEHQAVTRARFVAGDAALGARFEAFRNELIRMPRAARALAQEVVTMRNRMRDAHRNPTALFDVKHDPGGLVDVEFTVQFLVLAHAHQHAALTGNIGNIALLKLASELNLIDQPTATNAANAYREFRRIQHAMRLQGERYTRVPVSDVSSHREAVLALWQSVFGATTASVT